MDILPVLGIPIKNEKPRSRIKREGLPQLTPVWPMRMFNCHLHDESDLFPEERVKRFLVDAHRGALEDEPDGPAKFHRGGFFSNVRTISTV